MLTGEGGRVALKGERNAVTPTRKEAPSIPGSTSARPRGSHATHPLTSVPRPAKKAASPEERFSRELAGKDLLLRELGHRVKNSLAVIASLADIESMAIVDPTAASSVERLKNRVAATALLYDKLETAQAGGMVPIHEYITDLVNLLVESLSASPEAIRVELRLEPLFLDPRQAGAIGLIVNEAVTNSFKYGLGRGRGGVLRTELLAGRRGKWRLVIADDGPGLPPGFSIERDGDFGFCLIKAEAEELKGTLLLGKGPGARISVEFPVTVGTTTRS